MSGLARHRKAVTFMLASTAVLVLFALAYPRTVPILCLAVIGDAARRLFDKLYLRERARANIGVDAADEYRQRRRTSAFTEHLDL